MSKKSVRIGSGHVKQTNIKLNLYNNQKHVNFVTNIIKTSTPYGFSFFEIYPKHHLKLNF
ncbi:hypothetical protein HanIR_Chr12g0606771 [Helianthus annuus]|nr:hypothetical protein HanIR_Chr12g0606771 [Helianthus annuus]